MAGSFHEMGKVSHRVKKDNTPRNRVLTLLGIAALSVGGLLYASRAEPPTDEDLKQKGPEIYLTETNPRTSIISPGAYEAAIGNEQEVVPMQVENIQLQAAGFRTNYGSMILSPNEHEALSAYLQRAEGHTGIGYRVPSTRPSPQDIGLLQLIVGQRPNVAVDIRSIKNIFWNKTTDSTKTGPNTYLEGRGFVGGTLEEQTMKASILLGQQGVYAPVSGHVDGALAVLNAYLEDQDIRMDSTNAVQVEKAASGLLVPVVKDDEFPASSYDTVDDFIVATAMTGQYQGAFRNIVNQIILNDDSTEGTAYELSIGAKVWPLVNYLQDNVDIVEDQDGAATVQHPLTTIRKGSGNRISIAVAQAALLRTLGVETTIAYVPPGVASNDIVGEEGLYLVGFAKEYMEAAEETFKIDVNGTTLEYEWIVPAEARFRGKAEDLFSDLNENVVPSSAINTYLLNPTVTR